VETVRARVVVAAADAEERPAAAVEGRLLLFL